MTLGVSSVEETQGRVAAAFRGEQQGEYISFASVELLWKVLTVNRWGLLRVMVGQGAMTIREVARRVGRDVKAVHGDVHALLNAGVLDRTEDGRVIFPYDAVHVDFTIAKAAGSPRVARRGTGRAQVGLTAPAGFGSDVKDRSGRLLRCCSSSTS